MRKRFWILGVVAAALLQGQDNPGQSDGIV